MKIEIKNRWTGAVIFSHDVENNTIALTVKAASAKLYGSKLSGAELSGADLRWADLRGAHLIDANLNAANLSGANLRGADLHDAELNGANLREAELSGADLRGANLSGAILGGAKLREAYLTPIRDDIWAVLSSAPAEVPGLIAALKEGRVDGSTYTGECACLVGTLAHARHTDERGIPGLSPNSSRPAERFFMGIHKGATPETNQLSALALQWCEEWYGRMQAAFGAAPNAQEE